MMEVINFQDKKTMKELEGRMDCVAREYFNIVMDYLELKYGTESDEKYYDGMYEIGSMFAKSLDKAINELEGQ